MRTTNKEQTYQNWKNATRLLPTNSAVKHAIKEQKFKSKKSEVKARGRSLTWLGLRSWAPTIQVQILAAPLPLLIS